MYNNIPESPHAPYLCDDSGFEDILEFKVGEDIIIRLRDTKSEIGIDDGADIEYIIDGKFHPFVNPVFHRSKPLKILV